MNIKELDTPSLVIDQEIMIANIQRMQDYAEKYQVHLRSHTKTHKMPVLAKLQEKAGANGITVAKVGEAEVMAENGLNDIFVANQIVGESKLNRIKKLAETIHISFGVDSIEQCEMIEKVFTKQQPAQVLIEIEVGENRSGVIDESDYVRLVNYIKNSPFINLKGVFSHDGHTYKAKDLEECRRLYNEAQKRTLHFAHLAHEQGVELETVSIGSTPPLLHDFGVMEGITELRAGTYILMDVSQANALGSYSSCAASVLTTVISKPTNERIITDVGAKGLTMQSRSEGICATVGIGYIKNSNHVHIDQVFDEHAIIYDEPFRNNVIIGDKVEIIPNHICPVSNLYDNAYLVSGDDVVDEIPILCRGKLQ
ncbi:D-serine deaminase, pyridoxal phosphate-dependent [Lentibacillus persicus]|uniref:D-serine deaminase, pyridoxal phosphate-dependent n=1 Tax=Lentibacillus persicus TaxID=640948 RepID=A0A1I1W730_9BACI|nr:alanine racemase [Lentibacillus persicus]SFD89183.1 D-serine deaminase, pyridoxal phosphate-dependent [Lentibacillus persicus]